jgi:hypothetical protein
MVHTLHDLYYVGILCTISALIGQFPMSVQAYEFLWSSQFQNKSNCVLCLLLFILGECIQISAHHTDSMLCSL